MSQQELPFTYLNGHSHSHVDGAADPLDMAQLQHDLLSTAHGDSTAADPVLGDVLVAQGSPAAWARYAISAPAAGLRNGFFVDNGETVPTWQAMLDTTTPVIVTPGGAGAAGTQLIAARRDHDHPATDVASAATLSALSTTVNSFIALEYTNALAAGQQLTSNSTAFQNITNLIVPLGTNQVWRFAMTIVGLSTAAADWKFQFTVPAGGVVWFSTGQYVNVAGATILTSQGVAGTVVDVTGTAANYPIEVAGTVVSAGTAGNLQVQAAQNTATVETTDFIVQGSNIFARRVA